MCENHWVKRFVRVKRVDRRRMDELREEIGVQISLTGRLIPIVYSLLAAGCIVD